MILHSTAHDTDHATAIERAFLWFLDAQGIDYQQAQVFFEHGQWWARCDPNLSDEYERTYSVVDSKGGPTIEVELSDGGSVGFAFEQI